VLIFPLVAVQYHEAQMQIIKKFSSLLFQAATWNSGVFLAGLMCHAVCLFMRQFFLLYWEYIQDGPKNMPLYFCPYLCQLLINLQNSFTGTLRRQFAIT